MAELICDCLCLRDSYGTIHVLSRTTVKDSGIRMGLQHLCNAAQYRSQSLRSLHSAQLDISEIPSTATSCVQEFFFLIVYMFSLKLKAVIVIYYMFIGAGGQTTPFLKLIVCVYCPVK